jgi:hypothetical protein
MKAVYLVMTTNKPIKENGSTLRGYIGRQFEEYPILHHHIIDLGYVFTYPKVQYKIIADTASILGIDEGGRVLKKISDELDELVLGHSIYKITKKILVEQECTLCPSQNLLQYSFLTPWLALNPKNYQRYIQTRDWKERKNLLNSILIGNILSLCKGLGVVVDKELNARSHLEPQKIVFKAVPVIGFLGFFQVNFRIPDFFGLGKGVSQGFGVIKNLPKET